MASITTSSYNIALTNNGSGTYTPTILRDPTTVASGGTAVTIPFVENNNSGASSGAGVTTTLLPGVAIQAAFRAMLDNMAGTTVGTSVTTSTYNLYMANNGSGVYTPSVIKDPSTAASGGTSITIPWITNTNTGSGNTTTIHPMFAVQACLRAIVDNIAG